MKRKYVIPEMLTYSREELAKLIEVGSCSGGYSCMCHNGNTNAKSGRN